MWNPFKRLSELEDEIAELPIYPTEEIGSPCYMETDDERKELYRKYNVQIFWYSIQIIVLGFILYWILF